MKQTNFTWGRVPLSIFMFLCLGLSYNFAQSLNFTTPDINGATFDQDQCNRSPVGLEVTGLAANQSVFGYEFSDNGGLTWMSFGSPPPPTEVNDVNFPIPNGRQYRARIATTTTVFTGTFVTTFTDLNPITINIVPNITNPIATASPSDVICQDAPNTNILTTAANAISFDFAGQNSSAGPGACFNPNTAEAWESATGPIENLNFGWYEGFHGTYSITINANGCVGGVPGFVPITKVITIRRSLDASQTCATTQRTPTVLTGSTVVCEGETQTYTADNPLAFASPTGNKYQFLLSPAGAGTIASANNNGSTAITWANNAAGLSPATITVNAFGCRNPAGNNNGAEGFNTIPDERVVTINDRPILNSLRAEKATSCAGECVNFFVGFDYVNGSTGSVTVTYTVGGGAPQTAIIPANSNNALLTSVCRPPGVYSVVITNVTNGTCPQLSTTLPLTATVTVSPVPVVNSISSNIDDDPATPGVQTCEAAGVFIGLTAAPANPAFTYQWKKNGVDIPGATAALLNIPATAVTGEPETSTYEVMVMSPGCTNTASRSINVSIYKRPLLTLLRAAKPTTCEGECVDFTVSGATAYPAALTVEYNINGGPTQTTTIPAFANPAALASICNNISYTVTITKVNRVDIPICTQIVATLPPPVSVVVRPSPRVNSLTSSVDDDPGTPGVQRCEGGTITLTALPTDPTYIFVWKRNGVIIPNETSNTLTIPAALTNAASVSETTSYSVTVTSSTCPGSATRAIDVTIFHLSVGGTIAPALTKVCGALPVTLTLSGKLGTVVTWQRDIGCTGNYLDIFGTAGLSSYTFTTVPNTIICYRAVVVNGTCFGVASSVARVEADAPAVGGIVTLTNNAMNRASICPNQTVVLRASGFVGKIIKWQTNPITSPSWLDVLDADGQIEKNTDLTVKGSSLAMTTFYRVAICSPLSICTGPDAFAFSMAFRVSLKTNCAPPSPSPLVDNGGVPSNTAVISRAYPIPSNHRITLAIEGASEGDAQIEVIDLTGRVAIKETKSLQLGNNEVSFDISNLSNGIYIVKFMDSEKHTSSIKITKNN
jgi:Secretion system C-terminal sorting domain